MPSLRGRAAPASESAGPRVDRETGSHASASLVSNVVVLQKRRETQPSGQLGCLDPVSSVSVVPLARAHNGVGDGVGVGQQHGVQGRVRAEGLRVGASACEGTSSWTMTSSADSPSGRWAAGYVRVRLARGALATTGGSSGRRSAGAGSRRARAEQGRRVLGRRLGAVRCVAKERSRDVVVECDGAWGRGWGRVVHWDAESRIYASEQTTW